MFKILKGLYWYFRYSKRIIIPFTARDWDLLKGIGRSWCDGYPSEMQFGTYLQFDEVPTEAHWGAAQEMIDHSHRVTVNYLATYGLFPVDEVQVIRHEGDLADFGYATLGWKQFFEWRPTC